MRRSLALALTGFLTVVVAARSGAQAPAEDRKPTTVAEGKALFFPDSRSVVVSAQGQTKRYHLVGIRPFEGKDDPAAIKALLTDQVVRVEEDPLLPIDPDDAIHLGYVYRLSDGVLVNRELIAKGQAQADDRHPFLLLDDFVAAQGAAKTAGLGRWAPEPKPVTPQPAVPQPVAAPPELVPDPDYRPSPGDRVIVFDVSGKNADVWAPKNMFAYHSMLKSARAGDTKGIQELIAARQLNLIPSGTAVLVIQYIDNPILNNGVEACEVRFLDGPIKDQTAWVMAGNVTHLAPKPDPAVRQQVVPRPTGPRRR